MTPTVTKGVCVCVCACVYRQTSLPFFVNAWKENGLLVDGICDDAEGCNMISYRRMKNPKRGAITCDNESSGYSN